MEDSGTGSGERMAEDHVDLRSLPPVLRPSIKPIMTYGRIGHQTCHTSIAPGSCISTTTSTPNTSTASNNTPETCISTASATITTIISPPPFLHPTTAPSVRSAGLVKWSGQEDKNDPNIQEQGIIQWIREKEILKCK